MVGVDVVGGDTKREGSRTAPQYRLLSRRNARQSTSGKCSRWVWLDIRWESSQMNNTEEPNESETASTEANQPARRRSRRATRPVMAPDAVETADSAADSAAPEAPTTGAPAAKATKGKRAEQAEKPAEQPEPAPARMGRGNANASKNKELDILAELGEEEPAKTKEPAAKGDLSLDDLVLPEREGGSQIGRASCREGGAGEVR